MIRQVAESVLGGSVVQVYVNGNAGGGETKLPDGTDQSCYISVGLGCHEADLFAVLWHEAFEGYCQLHHKLLSPVYIMKPTLQGRQFLFDHCFFEEACADAGNFVWEVWPAVRKAWVEYQETH